MSSNLVLVRLSAAVRALREADVSEFTDDALSEHLAELSARLCAVDAQLTRLADAVRARGFTIVEDAPDAAAPATLSAAGSPTESSTRPVTPIGRREPATAANVHTESSAVAHLTSDREPAEPLAAA